MDFVARFLGHTLAYTHEVTELVPGERLVMRTADGPFPMQTTYTWSDAPPLCAGSPPPDGVRYSGLTTGRRRRTGTR